MLSCSGVYVGEQRYLLARKRIKIQHLLIRVTYGVSDQTSTQRRCQEPFRSNKVPPAPSAPGAHAEANSCSGHMFRMYIARVYTGQRVVAPIRRCFYAILSDGSTASAALQPRARAAHSLGEATWSSWRVRPRRRYEAVNRQMLLSATHGSRKRTSTNARENAE